MTLPIEKKKYIPVILKNSLQFQFDVSSLLDSGYVFSVGIAQE